MLHWVETLTAISTFLDLIKLVLNSFSDKCHLSGLLMTYHCYDVYYIVVSNQLNNYNSYLITRDTCIKTDYI